MPAHTTHSKRLCACGHRSPSGQGKRCSQGTRQAVRTGFRPLQSGLSCPHAGAAPTCLAYWQAMAMYGCVCGSRRAALSPLCPHGQLAQSSAEEEAHTAARWCQLADCVLCAGEAAAELISQRPCWAMSNLACSSPFVQRRLTSILSFARHNLRQGSTGGAVKGDLKGVVTLGGRGGCYRAKHQPDCCLFTRTATACSLRWCVITAAP